MSQSSTDQLIRELADTIRALLPHARIFINELHPAVKQAQAALKAADAHRAAPAPLPEFSQS